MVFKSRIDGISIVIRSSDAADVGGIRDTRKFVDLAPGAATILRYLNKAIVGAGIKQSFFFWGFTQYHNVSVERGRGVFGHCIRLPHPAHHRQRVAVDLASQVGTDGLPCISAIVTAENFIGSEV